MWKTKKTKFLKNIFIFIFYKIFFKGNYLN